MEEIRFFELGDDALNKLKSDEGIATDDEADDKPLPENKIQKELWLMCEHPESGAAARFVAIGSVVVIVISIVIFCLETLPRFKHYKLILMANNRTKVVEDETPSITDPFFLIETCCIIWFTVELVIRFLSSPSKIDFLKVSHTCSVMIKATLMRYETTTGHHERHRPDGHPAILHNIRSSHQ